MHQQQKQQHYILSIFAECFKTLWAKQKAYSIISHINKSIEKVVHNRIKYKCTNLCSFICGIGIYGMKLKYNCNTKSVAIELYKI